AEKHAEQGAGPGEEQMRKQAGRLMNILPAKQDEIALQDELDLLRAKALPDGAAMLVIDAAHGLIEHLPAALPGHVAEISIFKIERSEQRIEAAELDELLAVERAGAAAAVEAGIEVGDSRIDAVTHAERAVLPPALRQPSLLAELEGIGKEYLAGHGEDLLVGEAGEQRREEIAVDTHV